VFASAVVIVFPYYWMIASSLEGTSIFEWPPKLFPSTISFASFEQVIKERPIGIWFRNTFIVASSTAVFCALVSINAGYALSRFRNRFNALFGLVILFTQMLPATLLAVPLYVIYRQLGMFNSLVGVAIGDTVFILPLAIWLMKGFFDSIPSDLEAQAQVDGCTRLGAFYRITLPLALPGLVVVTVFAFMAGWDEFFLARTLITSQSKWVLSVGLTSFETQYSIAWSELMAAAALFALPAALFFLLVQRYLIQGLTGGAVKG
jgi:multiple sugar transport system permease protein